MDSREIVFCAQLSDFDQSGEDLSFLPPEEISCIRRCLSPREKDRRLAARLALKKALYHFFGIAALDIRRDFYGRPFGEAAGTPDFNLSHSGEFILGSLTTTGKTGIDVEQTCRLSFKRIARYLAEREQKEIKALAESERQRRLTDLWTCKEAYSKMLGKGLRLPFSEIAFHFYQNTTPELVQPVPDDSGNWSFQTFGGKQYRGTVCFPRGAVPRFYRLRQERWEEGLYLP